MAKRYLILFYLLSLAQIWIFAYELPEVLATRFNFNGQVTNWMSKTAFLWMDGTTMTVMFGMFYFLGRLMLKTSDKNFNLPNKEYWLAPERRQQTLQHFANQMYWLGVASLIFMMFNFEMMARANKTKPPQMPEGFNYGVALYIAMIFLWVYLMIRPFRKKPSSTHT